MDTTHPINMNASPHKANSNYFDNGNSYGGYPERMSYGEEVLFFMQISYLA